MDKEGINYDILRPAVEILGTEKRSIDSEINGHEYDLYINFPKSYWQNTNFLYPVIYVLNGQWDFSLITGAFGNQNYDGLIPEIIIVGITWSGSEYKAVNFNDHAFRDFSPFQTIPGNSGAKKFLDVIESEIIPFIEMNYPVTNDRTLVGGSLAGLFAVFAFLSKPYLFKKMIISSPVVNWANCSIFQFEDWFSKRNNTLNLKLSISWGEYEDSGVMKSFFSKLLSRKYSGLVLDTMEVKGTGHAGNKPIGFTYGLLSVFKKTELLIQQEQLSEYEGTYHSEKKVFYLKVQDNYLTINHDNSEWIRLYAEEPDKFYLKGKYFFLHFRRDTTFVVSTYVKEWDSEILYLKINTK